MRSDNTFGFAASGLRKLRALKTPAGIQKFLDALSYNLSFTARSPKKVLHDRIASCLEGGIFAAAALRIIGFPPLIFDLEAEQDTDHVVAIFKVRGHWGAVAKSNFTGSYREPVYRTLRQLAMSYFNIYFNLRGKRTLRRYTRPVNLARFDDRNWMTTEKPIWFIAEHLCEIPHISLLTPAMEKNHNRLDRRTMSGEMADRNDPLWGARCLACDCALAITTLIQWTLHTDSWPVQHVRINHGCRNVLVTEQLLHSSNVVTLCK